MESLYKGHRFPAEIIGHAVWLYHRFTLSFRDVEDVLAERGIIVSYDAIRFRCLKFGPAYARTLRRKQGQLGDICYVDEVFMKIQVKQHYLWRCYPSSKVINIDSSPSIKRSSSKGGRSFRNFIVFKKKETSYILESINSPNRKYIGCTSDLKSRLAMALVIWSHPRIVADALLT